MPVDVLWYAREPMSYSCCAMLNTMLDANDVVHHTREWMPQPGEGCVVVFHGGNERCGDQLAAYFNVRFRSLPFVIYISIGDEASDFPYHLLRHPAMKLWVQTAKPGKVAAHRYFLDGPPADCRSLLDAAGDLPRIYDWSFCGQNTHDRRHQLIDALHSTPGEHVLVTTQAFGDGLPHDAYYKIMKQTRVVPCPAGPATPDSFRFAEALEAGCVPVLDAFALDGVEGYWDLTLGKGHPFTVVRDWRTFPQVLADILPKWERIQRAQQFWWRGYKLRFADWLSRDLLALGAIS